MISNPSQSTFTTILAMCQMMLKQQASAAGGFLTTDEIRAVVDQVLSIPSFAGIEKEPFVAELEQRFTVVTREHQTLGHNDDHEAWLPIRRTEIEWKYWTRYQLYLEERVPHSAVESVDRVTNDILERIEDPKRPGMWDRRGLVMGHVQSGKTANYCGLVCKAADAGYKVIIILAGIHNSLRSQTQIRLEEGFLGFMADTFGASQQTFTPVGVGLIDSSIHANTGTSRVEKGDFNEKVAKQFGIHPGGLPLIFVVKKHVGVLNNLISWIRSCADAKDPNTDRKYVRHVPALIVDDESDLASVDTGSQPFDEDGKPDETYDPKKTNGNIRRLLRSFEKVAYVAYTATPFANIYIHDKGYTKELGDDLFPRSFIVHIPTPSNYTGPARIFGLSEDENAGLDCSPSLPITRTVTDHAASDAIDEDSGWMPPKLLHKTTHVPRYKGERQIPPSLRRALLSFILATAIRKRREAEPQFNSMLIHVVRFTNVQTEVAGQVESAMKDIVQRLKYGDGERKPSLQDEFSDLWLTDFVPTNAACNEVLGAGLQLPHFESVWKDLADVATGIRIRIINGSAGDILDYETHRSTGIDVIAIGGDKLSRGLTLEGLTVSYFLRSSKMYDTLMQMGRWFGYRQKYIDVCRLYTTAELIEWFTHIAAATEELQKEFEHMVNVGGTPRDYGLKVRSHPVMLVTSAVKMRNGTEMQLSFSGDISETIIFWREKKPLQANRDAVDSWVRSLGDPEEGEKKGGFTWRRKANVVLDLLATYRSHEDARRADVSLLTKYIKAQLDNGELVNWSIRLVSSGLADASEAIIGGMTVGLVKRAPFPEVQQKDRYTIRRLVSPADEMIDLSDEQWNEALEATRSEWEGSSRKNKSEKAPTTPSGTRIREKRAKDHAVLLIYPLDPIHAKLALGCPPVLGIAISFPKSNTAKAISYTVNNVFTSRGGDDDSY